MKEKIEQKFNKIVEDLYLKQPGNLAYYDSLTGCFNRTYYDREVRPAYCTQEAHVLYVDVDNLKGTNDRFGHSAGDTLIKGVASQLLALSSAAKVCRIGGDEFIVLSQYDLFEGKVPEIKGASCGYYHKGQYEDISSGVAKADASCQRAKRTHRTFNVVNK